MKKIFLGLLLLFVFLLTGCQNYNEKSIKNDINKNYKNLKGYHILGKLEVYSGDNIYKYNVESSKYNDNYRVLLVNKNNNHEQIIIKNDDGVYVLTPSLNKTFKFQSNWPENSSQVYLLDSIINDINSDQKMALVKKNDSYIVEANLAYSNNKNLVKEKIYFDKKINLKKIEVYDNDNVLQMKMTFDEIDKRSTFNDNYFSVKENMKTDSIKTEETMSEIEDAIYPMYLPSGTYLSSEENVSIDGGERVILTFSGESPFILVQETVNANEEDIPVSGEPEFILDTLGAVSLNSVNFISNGIEYYLSSDSLTVEEMMQVANSISPVAVMK